MCVHVYVSVCLSVFTTCVFITIYNQKMTKKDEKKGKQCLIKEFANGKFICV